MSVGNVCPFVLTPWKHAFCCMNPFDIWTKAVAASQCDFITLSHCTVNPVVSVSVLSLFCLYVGADGGTVDGLTMTLSTRGLQVCAFGDECYFMPRCFVFRECCMVFESLCCPVW